MSRSVFLFSLIAWGAVTHLLAQSPAKPGAPSLTPDSPPHASSPSISPTTKSPIDSTDSQQALELLRKNYVRPEALDQPELSRASFEAVLARLGRGVVLLPNPGTEPTPPPTPFYGEILDGHVGYFRLGDLTPANLDALDTDLQRFAEKKGDAVVIDLRASAVANDFAIASEFAKRFCPKGPPLFSLRKTAVKQEQTFKSDREPAFEGLTIILIDSDTAGGAEAVGGAIRSCEKALLIGQPTAGRAVEYSDFKLPSGRILRVAFAEVVLPDAQRLFPDGLKPDVPVEMFSADKKSVFEQSREKGMTRFVVENERPHLNEAALISGKNPEIDAIEEAQKKGHSPDKAGAHDAVLQRALDLVTSIAVFQKR
jgi:hypothetical protein